MTRRSADESFCAIVQDWNYCNVPTDDSVSYVGGKIYQTVLFDLLLLSF
jgi:hypothetical protein